MGLDEKVRIPLSQITYVDPVKTVPHSICYHTFDGSEITVRDTIEHALLLLGCGFMKSHRSVILSLSAFLYREGVEPLLIGNARLDSVIYDLAPAPTGRKERSAKHGRRLSIKTDFAVSEEKIGDYYTGVRRVLTNIFGSREVLAYVTASEKSSGSRRLFFSTVFSEQLQIFCAWQEKAPLNQTGSIWMKYIPLFLYSFCWNIEVSYYEQKTFWSFCSYMVRNRKGIEMLVNLINISYCVMKLLPYKEESFSNHCNESVQELRFALSEQICKQVFYATFVKTSKPA